MPVTRVQALLLIRHPFACCNVQLLGLGLIGYAAYLAHKEPSTFLYMVIGLGCGMVLGMVGCCFVISSASLPQHGSVVFDRIAVALMGFVAVGGSTKCLLRLYTFLMFVLFALHGTLAILIFFKKQKVIDWIHKYDKNDPNVDNAEHWVERKLTYYFRNEFMYLGHVAGVVVNVSCCFAEHITALGIATIVMVASEVCTLSDSIRFRPCSPSSGPEVFCKCKSYVETLDC